MRNRSPKNSIFNGSKIRSYFSPFVDQSSPDYVSRRRRDCRLQRRFPIVDTLFRSEIFVIKVQSRPKSRQKACFSAPIFWGEDPQILELAFRIAPISNHVAKFRGERPRDYGDLALNKKERKKQQQNKGSHVALSQRVALKSGMFKLKKHCQLYQC